jgi:hypothetical protein
MGFSIEYSTGITLVCGLMYVVINMGILFYFVLFYSIPILILFIYLFICRFVFADKNLQIETSLFAKSLCLLINSVSLS